MLKPDLFIHDDFYALASNFKTRLEMHVNLLKISDLQIERNKPITILNEKLQDYEVTLIPHYKQTKATGTNPTCTSYYFEKPMVAYHVSNMKPRYILWNKFDYIPICGTVVQRIEIYQLFDCIEKIIDWSICFNLNKNISVAVFDLDLTLIDDNNNKYDGSEYLLKNFKNYFDKIVLYSHGGALHVHDNTTKFDTTFDLVLSNEVGSHTSPKNLLHLYNYFKDGLFTVAWLIDDSVFNYCPEYTKMIVPKTKNVEKIVDLLKIF